MASIESKTKMASSSEPIADVYQTPHSDLREKTEVLDEATATRDECVKKTGSNGSTQDNDSPRGAERSRADEKSTMHRGAKIPGSGESSTPHNRGAAQISQLGADDENKNTTRAQTDRKERTSPNKVKPADKTNENRNIRTRVYKKECTLNIEVEKSDKMDIRTLLEEVSEICGRGSILVCVPNEKNKFELTMADKEACSLLTPAFRVGDTRVFAKHTYENSIVVSLMHLSPMIPDHEIEAKLFSYGCKIVSPIWRKRYEFLDMLIEDGTRYMKVVMPPNVSSLPYALKFTCQGITKHYRVIHTGQENVCNICCSLDHFARFCPTTECYKCHDLGHISFDCPMKICRDCRNCRKNCTCNEKMNRETPTNENNPDDNDKVMNTAKQHISEIETEVNIKDRVDEAVRKAQEAAAKYVVPTTAEEYGEGKDNSEMEVDAKNFKRKLDSYENSDNSEENDSPPIECKSKKISAETEDEKEPIYNEEKQQIQEVEVETEDTAEDDTLDLESHEKPAFTEKPYTRRKTIVVEPNYLKAEKMRADKTDNTDQRKKKNNKKNKNK